jgi:opacity protein-like surface antigen
LKIVFSIGYLHVDDQITTKLDDNSKKIIFVGYYQKYKGYNLYNPNERKIVISIAVEFNEGV